MRCHVCLLASSPDPVRCQLFAGHEGHHAILFAQRDGRHVRTWGRDALSFQDDTVEIARLPWMFGFPTPAWIDADEVVVRHLDPQG